eukprot:gnl/TRDRNA2_/TRDRNA2_90549_c0_seq2.p1 gnl/TRDRNA2_/TRDRNA2_90549_c0~~gnl/TRDRNA2_/TRDRNA2_90549_c0_seq2.p1  ORF type:complete len:290 (-),score=53.10 gnl/TRDRNA2_/TRDRNA2_90549_c0_seq2:87-956(-)
MPPLLVQTIGSTRGEAIEFPHPGPTVTIAELKAAIAVRMGIEVAAQRLVAHGRILDDTEILDDAGLTSGGRIFLARKSEVAEPEVPAADASAEASGSNEEASDEHAGFEVFVRCLDDAEGEVRVFARPSAPAAEFKREALQRLRRWPVEADELELCSFIFDGHLLGSAEPLRDFGVGPGAHIVFVPRRRRTSRSGTRACARVAWKCGRALQATPAVLMALPGSIWRWLDATVRDPWSLVRPREEPAEGVRQRRMRMMQINPRAFRYAPGQNPMGEDFTHLFTQGMLGGT